MLYSVSGERSWRLDFECPNQLCCKPLVVVLPHWRKSKWITCPTCGMRVKVVDCSSPVECAEAAAESAPAAFA